MVRAPHDLLGFLALMAVLTAACSSTDGSSTPVAEATTTMADPIPTIPAGNSADDGVPDERPAATSFPPSPASVPDGPLDPELLTILNQVFSDPPLLDPDLIRSTADYEDVRVAWELADLLRFVQGSDPGDAAIDAFEDLTDTRIETGSAWGETTDLLIDWDLPAAPEYAARKALLFALVEPGWIPFFADPNADVDWRFVSWGGVLIDDRPRDIAASGQPCVGGCIPALNDPAVTEADDGDWYPDDGVVFGVVVNDEARAYPKNQMEIHEMVNDTIGGRRIGLPYCTLCGSAQAFYTDQVPGFETLELRTSGLLSRSNKVMFDLDGRSMFDTFTGRALTGPLHDGGVVLEQATVQTSTWAAWKAAHPDTTIVAQDGGIGRAYPADPLQGRDDNGPIFPIGRADDRLGVQDQVVGVETPDGRLVAFPVEAALASLEAGGSVEAAGIEIVLDGGLMARTIAGEPVSSHQAFWFAWSQFHPATELWAP